MSKGFLEGCRPFIGVDGCFLKGPYKGQLLSALGRDGDSGIFPIAFAVVRSKTKQSWKWFMEQLEKALGSLHWFTFMSDIQKGLVDTFEDMLHGCHHRYYIIKDTDKGAYEWLANVPPRLWLRHKFEDNSKCDLVVNNLAETWNDNIGDVRDKPLITMLEWIRSYLMHRNQSRRQWIQNQTGLLCPTIATDLKNLMDDCRHCTTRKTGDDIFEVYYKGANKGVNLANRTCNCREWDVKGSIPRIHAIACIISERGLPENYVDSCYHMESYFRTYNHIIYPMPLRNLQREVGTDPIHPPIVKPVTGRPKKIYKMKLMQEEEELEVMKLMQEEKELEVMKLIQEEDELEVVQKEVKLEVVQEEEGLEGL
ncbi:uncharacterized protein LOC132316533 [Cornus florida]|uniref:uncharacterized protein LOC132316533 n=1 Tax=Cornus florida TaxID=4283 RepID=UPI0028A15238|nr:uncharacterized protein LOC132316533 [Cornus florida]